MRETICFHVLTLHMQCFTSAGVQHSCSLQELQCVIQISETCKLLANSTTKQAELPIWTVWEPMTLNIFRGKMTWAYPHLADLLMAPKVIQRKCFIPYSCCRLQKQCTKQPKQLSKGPVCMALQVFTCMTDSYQAFRACLQSHTKSCSNSSNLCRQLLFAFPSHTERLLRRIKAVTVATVESQQLIQLHVNFIPALTSIPLQQLPWIIKVQETRQVQQPISSVVFSWKILSHTHRRIKDECPCFEYRRLLTLQCVTWPTHGKS